MKNLTTTASLLIACTLVWACNRDSKGKTPEEESARSPTDPAETPPDTQPASAAFNQAARLTLNLRGAVGIALSKVNSDTNSANLQRFDAAGTLANAWSEGSAEVENMMVAPNGKIYLVFKSAVPFTKSSTGGMQTPAEDGSPIKTCILASVANDGELSCIDDTLSSINWNNQSGAIQFSGDDVYYSGLSNDGKFVLRKTNGLEKKDLVTDKVQLSDFKVVHSDIFLRGYNLATTGLSGWIRKINASGSLTTIFNQMSPSMYQFPDGNIYFGTNTHVARYLTKTSTLDSMLWIGRSNKPEHAGKVLNDLDTLCVDILDGLCWSDASMVDKFVTTSHDKTFALIDGAVVQYYPAVERTTTSVKKATLLQAVGDKLIIGGTNANDVQTLVSYDTVTGQEMSLIDEEVEVYSVSASSNGQTLMVSGLRFSTNTEVLIQVNMASGTVNMTHSVAKLSDVQAL